VPAAGVEGLEDRGKAALPLPVLLAGAAAEGRHGLRGGGGGGERRRHGTVGGIGLVVDGDARRTTSSLEIPTSTLVGC